MTTTIEARYINGRFLPLKPFTMDEGALVQITVTANSLSSAPHKPREHFTWEMYPPLKDEYEGSVADEVRSERDGD